MNRFEYHISLHHSQTAPACIQRHTAFEYHISLHHSQTRQCAIRLEDWFEYHISLHHSQTKVSNRTVKSEFEYHISLHHSQTVPPFSILSNKFEYHISLHHSQTSNSKMICHHLHKILVFKQSLNFTFIRIYNTSFPSIYAISHHIFNQQNLNFLISSFSYQLLKLYIRQITS